MPVTTVIAGVEVAKISIKRKWYYDSQSIGQMNDTCKINQIHNNVRLLLQVHDLPHIKTIDYKCTSQNSLKQPGHHKIQSIWSTILSIFTIAFKIYKFVSLYVFGMAIDNAQNIWNGKMRFKD